MGLASTSSYGVNVTVEDYFEIRIGSPNNISTTTLKASGLTLQSNNDVIDPNILTQPNLTPDQQNQLDTLNNNLKQTVCPNNILKCLFYMILSYF